MNGIDLQHVAATPTNWTRSYKALSCRLAVCRYASDVASEFRATGFYDYGEMTFSDVFYYPASLEPDVLPSYIGLSGTVLYCTELNHSSGDAERSADLNLDT